MSDLPPSDRPRERLRRFGPKPLTNQEILAAIIGRGTRGKSVLHLAADLLREFGGLDGLAQASVEQLMRVDGIGLAKATQIKAVFEIAERLQNPEPELGKKFVVSHAQDVLSVVRPHVTDWKTEHFFVLMLDSRGRLMGCKEISHGSLDATVVHPREVFKVAINASAAGVIFVHNHPSGDPEPSDDDIALTRRLVSASQMIGIPVHDHIIVTHQGFTSLRSRNIL
ncbi:MAG: DNA repair protein RadC [candidate division WOR-3 bacterium]